MFSFHLPLNTEIAWAMPHSLSIFSLFLVLVDDCFLIPYNLVSTCYTLLQSLVLHGIYFMEKIKPIIHWTAYSYYVYLFGYASLYKVFQQTTMMEGMKAFGFDKVWTLCIGYAELAGVISLVAGLWHHQLRNFAVIWLLFFAAGALMVHFAHNDYMDFYDALSGCLAAVVILATDKYFRIIL